MKPAQYISEIIRLLESYAFTLIHLLAVFLVTASFAHERDGMVLCGVPFTGEKLPSQFSRGNIYSALCLSATSFRNFMERFSDVIIRF